MSQEPIPVPVVDPLQMVWLDVSDLGNAERFVIHAGGQLRHVQVGKESIGWIAYDGQRWSFQEGQRLATLKAHDVAKGLRQERQALQNIADNELEKTFGTWCTVGIRDERIAAIGKHAIASGNHNKTQAMMAQAATLLAIHPDAFDTDPMAFNVRNGTLRFFKDDDGNWSVRKQDHEPSDMISRMAEVDYDPDADCPAWLERLNLVQPEADQRDLMQQIHGYMLVGIRSEQKFILAQGRGGDGKSLTYAVQAKMMGDYYCHAGVKTFLEGGSRSGSDHSEDLARLKGDIRLVTCDEPKKFSTFDTEILKQITGGEGITARGLREASSTYLPRWFLIMQCNPMPRVPTSDDGFWRRCLPFQWPVQFGELGIEPEPFDIVLERMLAESSGILNWMIEGCLIWLATRKLAVSKRAQEVKDEYRRSSDPFGEWLLDRADVSDRKAMTMAKDLYADFKAFCEAQGIEKVPAQKTFGINLGERHHRRHKRNGNIWREGIKLRPVDNSGSDGARRDSVAEDGGDQQQTGHVAGFDD